jgi:thiazolinyl reductase component of yersiniabactin synthetase
MMTYQTQPRRVLIVGAKFGEIYLNTFLHACPGLELAGLLARGSARSQQLAQAFGIPLYTHPDQLPDNIDIACVVVRSTVVSGQGTELARACLERGMHVIQEHPVHPTDIRTLRTVAQAHHCQYWINSYYPFTQAGQRWINDARTIRQQLGLPPQSTQLTTSRQLLYSTLDLWYQATDAQAVTIEPIDDGDPSFHLLRLNSKQGTATLALQRYLDPNDPDLHSLVMHRHTLNWPEGYLSMEASYGPVLWTSSLHLPEHREQTCSLYRLSASAGGQCLNRPVTQTRYPAPKNWRDCFELEGPAGIRYLLTQLCHHLCGQTADHCAESQRQEEIATLWQQIMQDVGPAEEKQLTAPEWVELDTYGRDLEMSE